MAKSRTTQKKLNEVAARLHGKELFPQQVEKARKFFNNLQRSKALRLFSSDINKNY